MKSPTAHLQELEQNIKSANILLESMPSGEIKADIDHLKIKAFVLLIHAALETYFEELGISAVKAARIKLKKGTISASLVSLITTSVLAEINEKSKKSKKRGKSVIILTPKTVNSKP